MRRVILASAIALPLLAPASTAVALELASTAWGVAARQVSISPTLLYAVALAESARMRDRRHAAPWPYAIHTPDGARYFADHAEASTALDALLAEHPAVAIDVGLMQINLRWHGHRVRSPHQLLDPAVSLRVAAEILAECIASAPGDLELGVGRYHQWKDETVARDYGRKVLRIAARLHSATGGAFAAH